MKHTPGPWRVGPYHSSENEKDMFLVSILKAGGKLIGRAYGWLSNKAEAEANAKLIAAAPELLEALQDVLAYEQRCADKGDPKIGNGILSKIHKAIKKATS